MPHPHFSERIFGAQPPGGSGLEHGIMINPEPYVPALIERGHEPGSSLVMKCSLPSIRECNTGSPETDKAAVTAWAEQRNRRHVQLQESFGRKATGYQHSYAGTVWLEAEDVQRIWPDSDAARPGIYRAVVVAQTKFWELDPSFGPENVFSITVPYVEQAGRALDRNMYAAVNERYVTRASNRSPLTVREEVAQFLDVTRSPDLRAVLVEAARNPAAYNALRHFTAGGLHFGEKHREALDIMGVNNAFITRDGRLRTLDVLTPRSTPFVTMLPGLLNRAISRETLNRKELSALKNGLHYVRTINFLSSWLHLPGRLCQADGITVTPRAWNDVYDILTAADPTV